ncbi:DCN1 [Malassezia furfur]|nr:DCN1 [Malassezia furfur]
MRRAVPAIDEAFRTNGPVLPPRTPGQGASKKGLYTTVYEYTFVFARSEGQKNLPVDVALTFWDLLVPYAPSYDGEGTRGAPPSFSARQYALWKQFLTEAANVRIISKDTWTQFLEFTQEIDPHFATHDFDAAWPSLIDEFVEWARKQDA